MGFNGARLRLARLFRDLTQSELAREVAASPALLSQVETGTRSPSVELIEALAHVLGFEPGFFLQNGDPEFREEECNFRRRRSTPERLLKRLAAQVTLFGMVVRNPDQVLEPAEYAVPRIPAHSADELERAAEACREGWGLPADAPIENLGRTLGRAGVALTHLGEAFARVGTFSRFGSVNVIVLDTLQQSPSRMLLDLSHELGHGVLHRGVRTGSPDSEREADRFAAAFLLPRAAFPGEFGAGRLEWGHLFDLKRRWGASVALILRRGYELRLLDAATYRRACKYMYAQGWARSEPHEPESEGLVAFPQTLEALQRERGRSLQDIAAELEWKPEILEEVIGIRPLAPAATARVLSLDEFREKRSRVGLVAH